MLLRNGGISYVRHKKVEDRLLEKETERLNTIKDSLNLGEKHPEEEKVEVDTGNKVYDKLLEKEIKRMNVQEEELGLKK